ncbi:unnamed protein product [Protopolystoma xenopodis]|uniref:Uncharacterized protein n=1 Tax=Protopolystoma xenopodis TaxID=117903 RepID=A0A448WK22_9PLAT|nr:unnamed protein product [Protopolystoma xenopodis]
MTIDRALGFPELPWYHEDFLSPITSCPELYSTSELSSCHHPSLPLITSCAWLLHLSPFERGSHFAAGLALPTAALHIKTVTKLNATTSIVDSRQSPVSDLSSKAWFVSQLPSQHAPPGRNQYQAQANLIGVGRSISNFYSKTTAATTK